MIINLKRVEDEAEYIKTGLKLQYDAASVKFLEGFIERNRSHLAGQIGKINSLGSFLGQCIIKNFGGQWLIDSEAGKFAIAFHDGYEVYPCTKVWKQFDNGLEDSIYAFYWFVPEMLKHIKLQKLW